MIAAGIVRYLHDGPGTGKLLPAVAPVNARQAWRDHITGVLDIALDRNDAELEKVSAAVIALTSVAHSTAVPPAPGLPRLLDIADYVLDNAARLGDAAVDIPGLAEAVAPTSTITGAALIHAAWAGTAEKLVAAGHVPDVWASVNRGLPGQQ
jgi:uncharacterized phosphosugar-binding protein